ncbi:histone acetyltransferase [Martiniozyma asiatica (nom. inval.)]|nr:histone acetyltransferase [Martiniozyma asiatica]
MQNRPKRILAAKAQVSQVLNLDEDYIENITPSPKRLKSNVNSTPSNNAFHSVPSSYLELPYRGVHSFADANTFETQVDDNFKKNFEQITQNAKLYQKMHSTEELVDINPGFQITSQYTSNKMEAIHFDGYEIDTWYKAPYPSDFTSCPILFICPHCLSYFGSSFTLQRHLTKCSFEKQPAGREIYRDPKEKVALFEIDGRKNVIFCHNLCLLAKLFLNSKTLYYDVEPFIFYVLFDYQKDSFNFIGYFSKEKLNSTGYNLSCIMTLPIYQRRGFGTFLIDFSYLLSRREFKLGSPEKPFSDLGLLSYRNYWKNSIIKTVHNIYCHPRLANVKILKISIDDLSNLTGMLHDDVLVGLEQLNALVANQEGMSNFKYGLLFNKDIIESKYSESEKKKYVRVNPEYLIWKPVILGPSGGINTNSTMVITSLTNEEELEPQEPLTDISAIYGFLEDDLDDDRDLEEQTIRKIINQNTAKSELLSRESENKINDHYPEGQDKETEQSTLASKIMEEHINTPPQSPSSNSLDNVFDFVRAIPCFPGMQQYIKSFVDEKSQPLSNSILISRDIIQKSPSLVTEEVACTKNTAEKPKSATHNTTEIYYLSDNNESDANNTVNSENDKDFITDEGDEYSSDSEGYDEIENQASANIHFEDEMNASQEEEEDSREFSV